jgi:YihY family inner membrane protein
VRIIEALVRWIDRWQQRHRATAFVFAVVKKFGDDRGGVLAALFAYYAFVALFPLLLLLVTILGFFLNQNADLEQQVLDSALRDFPIIGDQIGTNIHSLRGSSLGLVVGVIGLLWGALGLAEHGQFAMAEVWNIPGVSRPSFWVRLARSLALFAVLGGGVVASSVLTGFAPTLGFATGTVTLAGSLAVNVVVFLLAFRLLTPTAVPSRDLHLGAALAGSAWTALQTVGGLLVAHQLRHSTEVYGLFGVVLGLLSFLALAGTLAVYAAEVNVVRARRLWPRSIVQPPLTVGDRHVLTDIARQGRRRPEQRVDVVYDDSPPA